MISTKFYLKFSSPVVRALASLSMAGVVSAAGALHASGPAVVYQVLELAFTGPHVSPADQPTRNFEMVAHFRHEGGTSIALQGYWDGDGQGGSVGNVFKIRFTPTLPGRWTLERTHAPGTALHGQREGWWVQAVEGDRKGFWHLAPNNAGGRWFRRSNGEYPYIVGNTHYDFLFQPNGRPTSPDLIREDVRGNAEFFNKLRFCLIQPRRENADPALKPFFDARGNPTDAETEQPNPAFFHQRVDVAVREAERYDLIADLIMGGTTGEQVPATDGYKRYVAARYGAFPHVWITVGQEWNEQVSPAEMVAVGARMRQWLSYPTPLSTHPTAHWDAALNGDWHTHAIIQGKIGDLGRAAVAIMDSYARSAGKPVVNDENGYDPGEATTADVVEGITGSFLGGGYGTTGHRIRNKEGGYFWGHAALGQTLAVEHPSAPHLKFLRQAIDQHLPFWRLQPLARGAAGPFTSQGDFPVMRDGDQVYVLGTNRPEQVTAAFAGGAWRLVQIDAMNRMVREVATGIQSPYTFTAPGSRAVLNVFIRDGADFSAPVAGEDSARFTREAEPLRIKTVQAEISPAEVGRSYGDDLEASGGQPPYRWSLASGQLPPGIVIAGSELSGLPTQPGEFRFAVRVSDANGTTLEIPLVLRVHPPADLRP